MSLDKWREKDIKDALEALNDLIAVGDGRCALPDEIKKAVRPYVDTWIIHPLEVAILPTKPYWH